MDVWGTSATNVVAISPAGVLLRYNGSGWISHAAPRNGSAIWGTTSQEIFVTADRALFHYAGAEWDTVYSAAPGKLLDIWGTSEQDIFVVGEGGLILHYDGFKWTEMASATTTSLYAVWGFSGRDVFAVGNLGTILHYDGSVWVRMTSDMTDETLYDVWGSSPTDIFVVGDDGIVLQGDGSSWSPVARAGWSLHAVWGSSSSDILAVGQRGTVMRYDGTKWHETWGSTDFYGIWGTSLENIYVVGGGDDFNSAAGASIRHYDGSVWRDDAMALARFDWTVIGGVSGSSTTDVYFVGGNEGSRSFSRYDGWNLSRSTTVLNDDGFWKDVWVAFEEAVFLVDNDEVGYIDASTSKAWLLSQGDALCAVFAASATDAFVVGYGGAIHRYDGSTWTQMQSPTSIGLFDLWGTSSSDVFAVGELGTICHYDGSAWSVMPTSTSHHLRGVWGDSSHNVFAVGDSGTLLHYDGSAWNLETASTQSTLCDVWGSSASDVLAVGPDITLRYDGIRWKVLSNLVGGTNTWGTSSSDMYIADRYRIWHVVLRLDEGSQ